MDNARPGVDIASTELYLKLQREKLEAVLYERQNSIEAQVYPSRPDSITIAQGISTSIEVSPGTDGIQDLG